MRRIISVIGLAVVICALTAGSAGAQTTINELVTGGPNNGIKGNGGQSTNHAPPKTPRTCVPLISGTATAFFAGAPAIFPAFACP